MHSDEVSYQTIEIAEDIKELCHHVYIRSLLGKSKILCDKIKKSCLSVRSDESLHSIKTKGLYRCTCLCSLPC